MGKQDTCSKPKQEDMIGKTETGKIPRNEIIFRNKNKMPGLIHVERRFSEPTDGERPQIDDLFIILHYSTMETHAIDNSARRQPPPEEASEEGGYSELKKLFYNSTTVPLSRHRSMMARAMMHHVLTSGEGIPGLSSTLRSNHKEGSVAFEAGKVPLLPDQELHPFDESCTTPQYDPFCGPSVAFELSNLREFIDSEREVRLGQERVSTTTVEEDSETEDSIVIRRRQLLRQ